jgi:multiple sugar transport system substrate-binding protein
VAGLGDAMPEFDKALNLAINGGQDPAKVLADAAARATKILEANKKKYGG